MLLKLSLDENYTFLIFTLEFITVLNQILTGTEYTSMYVTPAPYTHTYVQTCIRSLTVFMSAVKHFDYNDKILG